MAVVGCLLGVVGLQEVETGLVVLVLVVGDRDQRPGV
jgi:hypothetical protein